MKPKNLFFVSEDRTFLSNGKTPRISVNETSVYDTSKSKQRIIFSLKIINSILEVPVEIARPTVNGKIEEKKQANEIHFSIKILGGGGGGAPPRRLEKYAPIDVATFIRNIDQSFESLAARFLQEVNLNSMSRPQTSTLFSFFFFSIRKSMVKHFFY